MKNNKRGVSIVIPTHEGGKIFSQCLNMIQAQAYEGSIQLIVIDSGSTDGTVERAGKKGAILRRIDKSEFHHARTRNDALSLVAFDRVIFMVQDAVPVSEKWLSRLTESLEESGAAAVYTGQVPHQNASLYARLETDSISEARGHNPKLQYLESLKSFHELPYEEAYRKIGLDNVCAIYNKNLLLEEPFPHVDFAEDLAWALKILLKGHTILYQPNVKVKHSHNRPSIYIFKRQIINALWCAEIMQRVREDLSFLGLYDLLALMNDVGDAAHRMGKEMRFTINAKSFFREILKSFPLSYRARLFLESGLPMVHKSESLNVTEITKRLEKEMREMLGSLLTRYPNAEETEYAEAMEQIAANALGRIFGETYGSYRCQGNISNRLERFMQPWLTGA